MNHVLICTKPTLGDKNFYKRWQSLGKIYRIDPTTPNRLINVIVVDQHTLVSDSFLARYPSLEVICSPTTGHTHFQFDLRKFNIPIISLRGETEFLQSIHSVSEYTFKLILDLVRQQHKTNYTLHGKTIGIVGHGRIGKHVEAIAKGFGMQVLTYDKKQKKDDLVGLFQSSDFVSIHLSEEEGTKNLINKGLIKHMKDTAYLINTARGSVINEEELCEALIDDQIAGAALDVIEDRNMLYKNIKNLVLSSHVAGSTLDDRISTDEFILNRVKEFFKAKNRQSNN